jgi:hypothetical protein
LTRSRDTSSSSSTSIPSPFLFTGFSLSPPNHNSHLTIL